MSHRGARQRGHQPPVHQRIETPAAEPAQVVVKPGEKLEIIDALLPGPGQSGLQDSTRVEAHVLFHAEATQGEQIAGVVRVEREGPEQGLLRLQSVRVVGVHGWCPAPVEPPDLEIGLGEIRVELDRPLQSGERRRRVPVLCELDTSPQVIAGPVLLGGGCRNETESGHGDDQYADPHVEPRRCSGGPADPERGEGMKELLDWGRDRIRHA